MTPAIANLLLAVTPDGLIIVNRDGVVRFANAAAARLIDRGGVEDLVGAPFGFPVSGQDVAEIDVVRRDRKRLRAELRIVATEWEGKPAQLVTLRDVTAWKQAQEALERANAELDGFVYAVSHDLKAPLRAVDNLTQWIAEDLGDQLDGDTRKHMDLLRSRVDRMSALIADLLTYSRVGHEEAEVEELDVGDLVREISFLLDPPAGFEIVIAPDLPTIRSPNAPLQQVLSNLVSNALTHHHRKDGRIEVAAREQGVFVELSVADDGPGIPPEQHERAFGMFQTLRSRDEVEGSGIGLALVKKTVEHHGGTVRLLSSGTGGATFRFTWPRSTGIDSTAP
ncbi:ATP-binding protein [Planctomycetota bacterium]